MPTCAAASKSRRLFPFKFPLDEGESLGILPDIIALEILSFYIGKCDNIVNIIGQTHNSKTQDSSIHESLNLI